MTDSLHDAVNLADGASAPSSCGSVHTPGPWILQTHKLFSGKEVAGSVVDSSGNTIRVSGFALSSGDEAEANTRLCAAAPDLLKAVYQLAQIVYTQNGNKYQDVNEVLDAANAAIDKATGANHG